MSTIHGDLGPLVFLLGDWEGKGRGTYPTVDDFEYLERATFAAGPGKPFISYRQQTTRAGGHEEAGLPLHSEVGYLRPAGRDRAELVVAQPTGIVEVLQGAVGPGTVHLTSATVAATATAKQVDTTERRIRVDGDRMAYEVYVGAVGQPHQIHLEATLERIR